MTRERPPSSSAPSTAAGTGEAKAALRRVVRAARALRPPGERAAVAAALGEALRDALDGPLAGCDGRSDLAAAAAPVAAHLSTPSEPGTAPLLALLSDRGVRVLLPVVLPDLDLDWVAAEPEPGRAAGAGWRTAEAGWRTATARSAHAPVPEPPGTRLGRAAISGAGLVLVPALAVDRSGARLGQGGGSYDRALVRVRRDAVVVAVVHDDELLAAGSVPAEPHDRRVAGALTPSGYVELTGSPSSP